MKKTLTTLALIFAFISFVHAQTETWTVYNPENSGLPDDFVINIDFDSSNTAWIGIVGFGLTSFNGDNWTTYNTDNSGIPGNTPFVCRFDDEGNMWTGTIMGASMYDGTSWTDAYGYDVWDIEIEPSGKVWTTTLGAGLTLYESGNWSAYSSSEMGTSTCYAVEIDASGVLWVGTDVGLKSFDGQSWTSYTVDNSELPFNTVISLHIDEDDNIWVGTGGGDNTGGLAKFDRTNWTVYTDSDSELPSNYINDIKSDTAGNVWIATGGTQAGGLVKLDIENNWTIFNGSNSDLPTVDNIVHSIAIDTSGCIWAGTGDGIGVLCENSSSGIASSLSNKSAISIYPNPGNGIFHIGYDYNIQNMELMNINGTLLKTFSNTNNVDIRNFPDGVYILRIHTEGNIINKKIHKL